MPRKFHDDPIDGPRCSECGAWWDNPCTCAEYSRADHDADDADMRHSDGEER